VTHTVPVTGSQYELAAGPYRATVTGLGAGLRELSRDGTPLIHGYDPDVLPPAAAGQLLAPWPNRIDQGRYAFDRAELQLAISEPARSTAIHGLTRWAHWSLVSQEGSGVTLRAEAHGTQGYPFSVELEAAFRLGEHDGLTATLTARNLGSRPAPYGNGWHPYLTLGVPADDCELTLPAAQWLPLDERGIPSGEPGPVDGTALDFREPRPIGATVLDSSLTALHRDAAGRAWAHLAAGARTVSIWAGRGYGWLQVFTGDPLPPAMRRRAVAIEPMSCPPNAFVTGRDLLTLAPGAEVTHTWGIQA
jgi:aldose 1-epimerase